MAVVVLHFAVIQVQRVSEAHESKKITEFLYPVYTIQPFVKPVSQQVVSCKRGFSWSEVTRITAERCRPRVLKAAVIARRWCERSVEPGADGSRLSASQQQPGRVTEQHLWYVVITEHQCVFLCMCTV